MRTPLKTTIAAGAGAALLLALSACGTSSDPDSGGEAADPESPLVVAASPTPHAEILQYVKKELASKEGLKLEIREVTDYVTPNRSTESGEVDANFFQHRPYLDDFNEKQQTHIVPVVNVHVEPLGVYSQSADELSELKPGQTVAVPNDTTNEGRALQLLADHGAIDLKAGAGQDATLSDIKDRKGLKFKEVEAAALPRSLGDVDAAVINGNYAIEADLKPREDALALEKAKGNQYTNFLAVKDGNQDDPRVQKLAGMLRSDTVRQYIKQEYEGAVVPAVGSANS